jgi:hypothetical protein
VVSKATIKVMVDMNEDNYVLLAAKAYVKPGAVMSEFEEDMNRVLYLKRLLTKYYSTGTLKDRLIMNHLIVLYNVFGMEATRMLFCKLDERDLEVIKPFLIFTHVLPEVVEGVNGRDVDTRTIRLNEDAIKCLATLRQSH